VCSIDGSWPSVAHALTALVFVVGCRSRSASSFEQQVAGQLTAQVGQVAEVECDAVAAPRHCFAVVAGNVRLPIRVTADTDQLRWRIDGLVVSAGRLEQHLAAQLLAIGVVAAPRCGPPLQVVTAGQRMSCQLPSLGVAWATIHADGSYSIEVAVGDAMVARTEAVDPAQLDALSRALDRAQGAVEDGEDDGGQDRDDANGADDGGANGSRGAW
jgi:hypothetical protein